MKKILPSFLLLLLTCAPTHGQEYILAAIVGFEAELEANQMALQKTRERLRTQYREALGIADKTYRAASDLDAVMSVQKLTKEWENDPTIPDHVPDAAADLAIYADTLLEAWKQSSLTASVAEDKLYTEHMAWIRKELNRLEAKGQATNTPSGKGLTRRLQEIEKRHSSSATGRFHRMARSLRAMLRKEEDPEKSALFPLEDSWISVSPENLTVHAPKDMPIAFATEKVLPQGYAVEIRSKGDRAGGLFSAKEGGAALFVSAPKGGDWHTYRFEIVKDKVWGYIDGKPVTMMLFRPGNNEFRQLGSDDESSPLNTAYLHPGISLNKGQSAEIEFIDTMRYK